MSDCAAKFPMGRWQRHDLLRISPDAWSRALATRRPMENPSLLAEWCLRKWPVIVRRRMACDEPTSVPIGVPLPPAAGKPRTTLTVPPSAILERISPVPLRDVLYQVNAGWRAAAASLIALGAEHNIEPKVFGSALWQHQTGLAYMSPESDIDVIWQAPVHGEIRALLIGIANADWSSACRIDGEIVFRDGSAVNWRELHYAMRREGPREVLVKTIETVKLIDCDRLLEIEVPA